MLRSLGCDEQTEAAILNQTTDPQEVMSMWMGRVEKLEMPKNNEEDNCSPPSNTTTLNIWRIMELGFPEELAFNALMVSVCFFFF